MKDKIEAVGQYFYDLVNQHLNDVYIFWFGFIAIIFTVVQVLLAQRFPVLGSRALGLVLCLISAIAFLCSYAPLFRNP